jgi:hypothetical protein
MLPLLMPRSLRLCLAPLAFLLFALAGSGCAATGYGTIPRPSDGVIVSRPAPPPPVRSARVYRRAETDAARYARDMRPFVGLTARQERAVREILADRTVALLDRTHPRDHPFVYPFPRRAHERDRLVQRWWRDSDRAVERVLDRQQRRAYQDYVRSLQRQDRRGAVRPAHPHGGPPGPRRRG